MQAVPARLRGCGSPVETCRRRRRQVTILDWWRCGEEPRRRLRRGRSQSPTLQGAHPPTSHTRTPSPTMASLRWPSGRGRRISGGDSQEAARSPPEVIADLGRWAMHAAHLGLHRAEAAPPVVVPILPPENHPREEPEPSPSSTIGTSSGNPVHRPVCADTRYGRIGVGVSLVGFAPQPHLPLPWCRRSPLGTQVDSTQNNELKVRTQAMGRQAQLRDEKVGPSQQVRAADIANGDSVTNRGSDQEDYCPWKQELECLANDGLPMAMSGYVLRLLSWRVISLAMPRHLTVWRYLGFLSFATHWVEVLVWHGHPAHLKNQVSTWRCTR
ncbi:unnamed protein product [Urochloa humidicola]